METANAAKQMMKKSKKPHKTPGGGGALSPNRARKVDSRLVDVVVAGSTSESEARMKASIAQVESRVMAEAAEIKQSTRAVEMKLEALMGDFRSLLQRLPVP